MSVPIEERWYSNEWRLELQGLHLTVSSGWAGTVSGGLKVASKDDFMWEVWTGDGRALLAGGRKPTEKAAKLAARRWVEAQS